MKHRIGSLAGALGCLALLVAACGGSSFEGVEGSASGGDGSAGDDTAGGSGKTNGGSATAGKSSGGSSSSGGSNRGGTGNGGTASGGISTGGISAGGISSGGVSSAGAANGGTTSGGSDSGPLACNEDADCAACRYPTAPTTAMDCYCPGCGQTPRSKATCTANQTAWQKQCSKVPIPCPAIECVEPPVPQCKSHMCVVTMQ